MQRGLVAYQAKGACGRFADEGIFMAQEEPERMRGALFAQDASCLDERQQCVALPTARTGVPIVQLGV